MGWFFSDLFYSMYYILYCLYYFDYVTFSCEIIHSFTAVANNVKVS